MVSADADDQAAIGRTRNIVRIGFMDSSGMRWAPKVKLWARPEPYLTAAMYRDGGAEEGPNHKKLRREQTHQHGWENPKKPSGAALLAAPRHHTQGDRRALLRREA
jgi:hypothetical protein